ncbi:MAG: rhodanese-like domain-containing protein [Gammaproteobacteria bacterium]
MAKTVEELVKEARAAVTEVDVERARELHAAGATFIDVREPPEWDKGTVEGALRIPRGVLEWKVGGEQQLTDRSAPVVVYCQSGGRSAMAARVLGEMGWTSVVSLAGGYGAWSAE